MKESVEEQKKKSLKLSIVEGSTNSVMVGAGNSFLAPFALALNASNLQIGFLSSFVGLIGPLAQLKSSHLMERYTRKKIVITMVLVQALMWLPIILLAYLFYKGIWLAALPIILIVFYSLHIGLGAVAGPPWFSWMGDLVPEKIRGRYFSKRNRISGAVTIITMLVAGFLLDWFKTRGWVLIGFSVLFATAMSFRIYSSYLFKKHYAPEIKLKKGYYFSFKDFLIHSFKNNFGKFAIYVGMIHLAVSIASPFFTVYMLRELGFTYMWFTIVTLSSGVFSLLALPFWGKFADKYGNKLVIVIASFFIPLVPILWIFSTSKLYLILVPSLIGGVFWGGFNLSAFNFIYDSVKREHRALCSAYYNMLMGIGIFAGAIIGGLIAKYAPITFMSIFLFIFLVSGLARALMAIIFLPQIKEVRKTKRPPVLIRELEHADTFAHGVSHFNSLLFDSSHLPSVKVKDLKKMDKLGGFFLFES